MNEMQNVFVVNPNISRKCKKYIWFRGKDIGSASAMACKLLKFFLRRNIHIDGFATDVRENVGICLWNKKIIHISDTEQDALVFSDYEVSGYSEIQRLIEINPLINKENIVVYGAGLDGCHLLHAAKSLGLAISMFIDSNKEKVARGMEDIPIYGAETINKVPENASVIVAASSVYQEIDQFIREQLPGKERFLYNLHFQSEELNSQIYLREREIFEIELINWMEKIVRNKRLYVYGVSERSKKLIEIYELLDFKIIGYVDDEEKENQDGSRPVIAFEKAVNEKAFFLLISRWDYRKNFDKLERMKFRLLRDYGFDNPFGVTYVAARNEILDVNLGVSYIGKQGMRGFTVIGKALPSDTKIVILGSSTTDGEFYPFKSWPEFLADRLEGKNITIYNGGMAGYTTSHELLKLLRDVLYMNPDMVITYDGNMDIAREVGENNPFAFLQLNRIMKYVSSCDEIDLDYDPAKHQHCTGIKPDVDRFNIWLSNIKRMEAVCRYEKIRFLSFLAPTLNSKPEKTKEETGMIWSRWINDDYDKWTYKFREEIRLTAFTYDYIYDLSDIFDNENDVYMDGYHVFEKGNKIIADSIYGVVQGVLEEF